MSRLDDESRRPPRRFNQKNAVNRARPVRNAKGAFAYFLALEKVGRKKAKRCETAFEPKRNKNEKRSFERPLLEHKRQILALLPTRIKQLLFNNHAIFHYKRYVFH